MSRPVSQNSTDRSRADRSARWWPCVLWLGWIVAAGNPLLAFDHTYAGLGRVLAAQVRNGAVNYAALKEAPRELDQYLDETALVSPSEFDSWSKPQQLAFLINLYNAATLKLVTDHYPIRSIRNLGGLFGSPWKLKIVRFGHQTVTLDHLEHDLLRAHYSEPRIHFALVCAAKSCPPLRPEPYTADRLDGQLDDQARIFLRTPEKNRVDIAHQTLWLSPIFKWFEADFTIGGKTLTQFIQPFVAEAERSAMGSGSWTIKFTDYDWSLNSRETSP